MPRTIEEPVFVRTRDCVAGAGTGTGAGDAQGWELQPDQFIWRGRLYLVQAVLEHWRQRQPWWSTPAALAVHGAATSVAELAVATDRAIWRVVAAPGRRAPGIFELCYDDLGLEPSWRLLSVDD